MIENSTVTSFLFLTNLFSTIKIEDLIIPEVVQKGNISAIVLDCVYNVAGDGFNLYWLFNQRPVYEWRPPGDPIVRGILEGRLDLTYKVSDNPLKSRRALRILYPDEYVSGEYTCVVNDGHTEARRSSHMLVFSPQHNLSLYWQQSLERGHRRVEVACAAFGVYPQPEIILERNHIPVERQEQKVWRRGDGALFDALTLTYYEDTELRHSERFTCRLEIPAAGYMAMTEKSIMFRNSSYNSLRIKHLNVEYDFSSNSSCNVFVVPSNQLYLLLFHCSLKWFMI